jgi:hypothetical protein
MSEAWCDNPSPPTSSGVPANTGNDRFRRDSAYGARVGLRPALAHFNRSHATHAGRIFGCYRSLRRKPAELSARALETFRHLDDPAALQEQRRIRFRMRRLSQRLRQRYPGPRLNRRPEQCPWPAPRPRLAFDACSRSLLGCRPCIVTASTRRRVAVGHALS